MDAQAILLRLRANAGVFDSLCEGVPETQARWKPSAGAWSILEVVNHLADEEEADFRMRVNLTLHHPGKRWPSIDPPAWVTERGYNQRGLGHSVARFLAERDQSVAWLEDQMEEDWARTHEHPALGTMTAGQVLTAWVAHDMIHIRQINRLHREYLVAELSEHSPDYAGQW